VKYFDIRVLNDSSDSSLTISCDGKKFTQQEYGEQIFQAVSSHVLEKRQNGTRYPIFISEIDLPCDLLGVTSPEQLQTIHFLEFKNYIEGRLNAALVAHAEAIAARSPRACRT